MRRKTTGNISPGHQPSQYRLVLRKMQLSAIDPQGIAHAIVLKIGFFEVQQNAIGKSDCANTKVGDDGIFNDGAGWAKVRIGKCARCARNGCSHRNRPACGIGGQDIVGRRP